MQLRCAIHRWVLLSAAALLPMVACGDASAAHYLGDPARNFSAYYYRSPGGIGPARTARLAPRRAAATVVIPYAQSCGSGRTWDGTRCIRRK